MKALFFLSAIYCLGLKLELFFLNKLCWKWLILQVGLVLSIANLNYYVFGVAIFKNDPQVLWQSSLWDVSSMSLPLNLPSLTWPMNHRQWKWPVWDPGLKEWSVSTSYFWRTHSQSTAAMLRGNHMHRCFANNCSLTTSTTRHVNEWPPAIGNPSPWAAQFNSEGAKMNCSFQALLTLQIHEKNQQL